MSIYEKFNHQFDVLYQRRSPQKVDDFIEETKCLLSMMTNSSRPTSHLKILTFTKVAQRVLSWNIGERATLMNLLWHVATEVSKSFLITFPASKFPNGGGKNMPTFISFLGDLSIESYYRFMRAHPVESSLFARNTWPTLLGDIRNTGVLKQFSEFLTRGFIDDSLSVLSKSLSFLTVQDSALRTIMIFLASKCNTGYEAIWDEAKEDVLDMFKQTLAKGGGGNLLLRTFCYGDIPENREFTYLSCMPIRGWRPPGESYMVTYNSFLEKYSALVTLQFLDYRSTNYITVEKEFGYFLDKIIGDFRFNSNKLNTKCLELLTAMTEHHFKTRTKPLVHFIKTIHNSTQGIDLELYFERKSLDQFKTLLQLQALGQTLATAFLQEKLIKPEIQKNSNALRQRLWPRLKSYKALFKAKMSISGK